MFMSSFISNGLQLFSHDLSCPFILQPIMNSSAGRGRMTTSHKLGFFLILVGLAWGLYLLRLTVVFEESRHRESDILKARIIELSKNYISALSKEHALESVETPLGGRSLQPCK